MNWKTANVSIDPRIVATGGYAKWVLLDIDPNIRIDADLRLLGPGSVYEIQKKGQKPQ